MIEVGTACLPLRTALLDCGVFAVVSLGKICNGLDLQSLLGRERLELLANRDRAGRAVEQWIDQASRLAGIELQQHGLHRSDRGWGERQRAVADRDQGKRG